MNLFSIAFLLALAIATITRLWLTYRHVQHIQAHRSAVPTAFANDIALDAHQKAADYNGAKAGSAMVHAVVDSGVLLILTFGGLLQWLDDWAGSWFGSEIARGTALIAFFAAVTAIIDLPFSWYRTFKIEARFGFNRMTLSMWLGDLAKTAAIGAAFGAVAHGEDGTDVVALCVVGLDSV